MGIYSSQTAELLVSTSEPTFCDMQAGYNPLMLAVANDIEIADYQDMLYHLIDKTGVNLTAEKVIPLDSTVNTINLFCMLVFLCRIIVRH